MPGGRPDLGIGACEALGVNECVVTCAPEGGSGATGDVGAPTGEVTSTGFLRTPDDLRASTRKTRGLGLPMSIKATGVRAAAVLVLLFATVLAHGASSRASATAEALVSAINQFGPFVKTSTDAVTGDVDRRTYENRIAVDGRVLEISFESRAHERPSQLFGYASGHYLKRYEFDVCAIDQYYVVPDNSMRDAIDEPRTGHIRLWVRPGYDERIDLDRNGGDDSYARSKGSFHLEMIFPDGDGLAVEVMGLILRLMRESGCEMDVDRYAGSVEVPY
jgi:hypothetical protein